jgi:hypothetical protein
MDVHECVLHMSFFHQVNPVFDWRARTMCVQHKKSSLTLHANPVEQLPILDSDHFELCSINAVQSVSQRVICVC